MPWWVSAAMQPEECIECHEQYRTFLHGSTICTSCHTDISSLPHKEKLRKTGCATCHPDTVKEYATGVHEKKGVSCTQCHNVHSLNEEGKDCTACHKETAHRSLPSQKRHLSELACIACHGTVNTGYVKVEIRTKNGRSIRKEMVDLDKNDMIDRAEWDHLQSLLDEAPKGNYAIKKTFVVAGANAHAVTAKPARCRSCHMERKILETGKLYVAGKTPFHVSIDPGIFIPELPSSEQFRNTVHGRKGVRCIDCHMSQNKVDDRVCMRCHTREYTVYKHTLHAKKNAAKCTDCHNPHLIKTYKQLSSKERLAVCSRCHKDFVRKHGWLPNTIQHFEHLECSTCHSPKSQKGMVFYFETRRRAESTPLTYEDFASCYGRKRSLRTLIDRNHDGTVSSLELTDFFTDLRRKCRGNLLIGSSIIVTDVYHDYSEKSSREKICTTCHSDRAPFYSSMYLKLPEKDYPDHIPVKGTILSEVPISVFIDICLLGQEKIKPDDLRKLFVSGKEERQALMRNLGFKWIDIVGIILTVFMLVGITVHVIARIIKRR